MFIVVETLLVKLPIRTSVMHKCVTGTYPTKKQLKPLCSKPMTILSTGDLDKLAIATAAAQQGEEHHDSDYTWVSETKSAVKWRVAKRP